MMQPATRTTRRGLRVVFATLATACVLATVLAPVPAPALSTPASDGLAWLSAELDDNGFRMPSSFDPAFTDWGLTIDAGFALAAGGQGGTSTAASTRDNVLTNAASYVTGADFGSPDERYAGPLGKALLFALVQGQGTTHDGLDLESELRARMQTSGAQAGRFTDASEFGDFSNGLGQAFAVTALDHTSAGVPAGAVSFLLAQQCPAGGFRLNYDGGDQCTSDAAIDTDATSMALQALLALPSSAAVESAIDEAVTYLVDVQRSDGSFSGTGPTATPNANSTGLAAGALRAAAHVAEANAAAAYVEALQLTSANGNAASADSGAIAYDPSARDAAKAGGIAAGSRDQFRRATAKGVLALGLPTYAQIGTGVQPVDPHPGATVSPASASPGSALTVSGWGFMPNEAVNGTLNSDPVELGTETAAADGTVTFEFVLPADLEPGAHEVTLVGTESGVVVAVGVDVVDTQPGPTTVTPTGGTTTGDPSLELPRTGTNGGVLLVGTTLLALGAALVFAGRRTALGHGPVACARRRR
jgi:hypothetical protein